ncbi:HD domain-containing protein [Vulcanisaeta distributa]|uniref:Metal dependent phosphohydrolase n=1 Tax=Vulcanisaeta distributa (strain DSM 14429 / JCM 11212 / NBRC 100878 / IC-017) TaxID=572478 RepID=E1QUJ8_VULDI|nr:HD domain-containing protein [Vulcanisaeta distributa]ADN51117.1 metal dependent phosphohydrolase [Vulcanisaeta distributa DSM 14429]
MTLSYTKVIADPALGWIRLTNEEARFIDSCRYIQRLRYIHQLGLTFMVYPSAHHSRFEHSLGTLQIVTLMLERMLRSNDVRESLLNLGKSMGLDTEDDIIMHMRIAALLHDLGHLPFSHVFEGVFGQGIDPLITNCSRGVNEEVLGRVFKGPFKEHELITYFILTNNDEFKGVFKESMPDIDLRVIKALLHSDIVIKISELLPQFIDVIGYDDIAFLKSLSNELKSFNILRNLISGDLDADRVEYVLRDSYLTGASIGSVISISDIERILDNMKIVRSSKDYVLAFDEKARANLEGFIIARFNIYKLVYLHHKVVLFNTLARNLMNELLRHYDELNDDIKDYLCQLYRFSIGHLKGYDVMYIIDDYLLSVLLRNRQYLINKIRGISKFLDPLITRSTTFKALWKRDFEFINLVNKQGVELALINDVFPYLLSKGESRDEVLQAFYNELKKELSEAPITCLRNLTNNQSIESSVIIGFRIFEPEARLSIIHGDSLVSINELSPLAISVADAWKRSPHVFVFVDIEELGNACQGVDINIVLDYLRGLVVKAMYNALRGFGNIISKYFNSS